MKIAKHDLMRSTNTLSIIECIRRCGPIAKKQIQTYTGLSWGAISSISAYLLDQKVISEFKNTEKLIGRTPSMYEINSSENLIIGIDINFEGLVAVLIDLKCSVVKVIHENINDNQKNKVLDQAKSMLHTLLKSSGVDRRKLIGIGIAMQGTVDVYKGISVFSPYFADWKDVPIRDIFEKEFGLPVFIEHDPNCMALTERWLGNATDIKNLLFIRLSMGIGLSIMINGEIYRGTDGSAGEFGHITINPDGARCTCGNYGCLEVYSSGRSIVQQAREAIKMGKMTFHQELGEQNVELDLYQVIELGKTNDAYVMNILDSAAGYLGVGLSILINIFNPDLIIIGGEMAKCYDLLMERTSKIVRQNSWKSSNVNIAVSKFVNDSAAIGAAAIFIQKIFSGELHYITK